MTNIQIYFLIFLISLVLSFIPWILMQMYFDWEIFWGRIAVFGFISLIITILVGLFYILKFLFLI